MSCGHRFWAEAKERESIRVAREVYVRNQQTASEISMRGIVRHGPARFFSPEGTLTEAGEYSNGLRVRNWKYSFWCSKCRSHVSFDVDHGQNGQSEVDAREHRDFEEDDLGSAHDDISHPSESDPWFDPSDD
jgi:hypothetical protein